MHWLTQLPNLVLTFRELLAQVVYSQIVGLKVSKFQNPEGDSFAVDQKRVGSAAKKIDLYLPLKKKRKAK